MELLQAEATCHHCGDPCDHSIESDNHNFCCYGCKAVFELLSNSHLNKFYSETSLENKSLSEIKAERKFSFLENEDVQKQLLKFRSDNLSVIKFFLPGIHCSSCIYLLEHLPKLNPAVLRSEVNFVKKEVTISFSHAELSLKDLAILLSQLGYPPNISLESLDKTKNQVVKSNIGVKIAVAGFCFGNTMLMSMPEYLDHNFQLTDDFKQLFGWINLALTLPVMLYAARDYFVKAWKGLTHKNLNIDVPIALGITTLFLRTVFEIVTESGVGYADSLTGLVFFLLIGKWYQGKSYQALSFERDYSSYFPVSITALVEGTEQQIQLSELKKGDQVIIHHDELIPADGVIASGEANIDYSFVTGESKLVNKKTGENVFAGGRQKGGELTLRLNQEVKNSELTRLWNNEAFRKKEVSLATWIDKISQYFTLAIILIGLGTGIYWWIMNPDQIWNSVTAVLIVACPCALALTLPFAYGHAMRILGKNGLYLKNAEVIESISEVDTIVFDKTGTLTQNEAGTSYFGENLNAAELRLLRTATGNSAHPLSRLIHNQLPADEKLPIDKFEEYLGSGFEAKIGEHEVKVGSAAFLNVKEDQAKNESKVHVWVDGYKGYFSIKATYRKDIFDMLKELGKQFKLNLLSGDNSAEKGTLSKYFDELKFKQKPKDKLAAIESFGPNTCMIGDGLNDAGALRKAHVGIAVTEDIHQFSPACDSIISAENQPLLPGIFKYSKQVIRIVFIAFAISFLYNVVGLSFAVTGNLTPLVSAILMPISSVTVVGFVTLATAFYGRKLRSYNR